MDETIFKKKRKEGLVKLNINDNNWRKQIAFVLAFALYSVAIVLAIYAFASILNYDDGWKRTSGGIALFFSCVCYMSGREAHNTYEGHDEK